jgi:Ca-activated chloride channel family protein
MGFHHPTAFFLLIGFALAWGVFKWARARRRRDLQRIGDWRLVSGLVPVVALRRRRVKDRVALGALLLTIIAATGPLFGTRLKEVKQRGVDVFICIDTSRSMLAEDVAPNRLDRAKRSLGVLIEKLAGNRVGIVAFAKRAVLQCPLTIDPDAARLFLDSVTDHTVPEQGTGVGSAIRLALGRFPKDAKGGRAIVLLTDGEDTGSEPEEAAHEAKKAGVPVFTIGIGTTKGEVIKDRDEQGNVTSFHKYKGEMVVSHLDDAMLTKIAEITGGAYYRASSTDAEVDEIADTLNGFKKRDFAMHIYDRLQERYQPFAILALFLLLLEFFLAETPGQKQRIAARLATLRRKEPETKTPAAVALVILALLAPGVARADVRDRIREGNRLFQKKDFAGAAAAFESAANDDPDSPEIAFDLATAYYAAGKTDDALKAYDRAATLAKTPATKARIAYNQGHALYNSGKAPEALEKFKETLRLDPTDADAKYNVEYIRSGKTPPQPKPNPSPSPNNQNEKNDKDKKGQGQQNQQKQDQGKKGGEGQDQQNKDQNQSEEPQPKPGELSKEEAEQILQMSKEQEQEKMKARPVRPLGDKNEKPAAGGEDW